MASSNILPVLALLFLSLSSLALSQSQRCHPNDEKALLQFKKDLNNPNELITWVPKTDCCKWDHLSCDNTTHRVTQFTLVGGNFHLPIPAAVGEIKFLNLLQFLSCNFTGSLPESISKLSQLNTLIIINTIITGPIPSSLGNLKKLTFINLQNNGLTGPIPASLSQLPLLGALLLGHNKLTGRIPESFGDFKGVNFVLYLNDNQLSGKIPRSLGNVKTLFSLDVARNRLEGDISFLFGKNQSLQSGIFSSNKFRFDFSKVELSDIVTTLELDHNQIYGRLPAGLTKSALMTLNVSYNRLCGRIPVLGPNLQSMGAAAFSNNRCLCGTPLPECK